MDYGKHDEDAPLTLIEMMVDELSKENPDVILINGDYIKHGLASRNPLVNNFNQMIPIF